MEKKTSIGFAPQLIPLILNGTKTVTYRLGNKYDFLQLGQNIPFRNSATNEIIGNIKIMHKSHTMFKDLPINGEGHEIYTSKEQQKQVFEKYYGQVNDNDRILILQFNVVKA